MVVDIVQNVPLHTGTRQRINQKIRCTQQNVHVTQPSYGKMCLDFPVRTQPSLSDHIEKDTFTIIQQKHTKTTKASTQLFETTPLAKRTARLEGQATPKTRSRWRCNQKNWTKLQNPERPEENPNHTIPQHEPKQQSPIRRQTSSDSGVIRHHDIMDININVDKTFVAISLNFHAPWAEGI